MDIVVSGIIAGEMLDRVPGERIAAMVIHGLQCRQRKEDHALSRGQAGDFVGNACAEGIKEESFEGVVIESAVGIGDVEPVVAGVELCYPLLVELELNV
jgi:hypothetical protein